MIQDIRERIVKNLTTPAAKWSIILFLLALIPRMLWAIADHPRLFSDMEDYYLCAMNFLKGDYLAQSSDRLAYRAPMYPLFLAACLRVFPEDPLLTIRTLQSILGSISAVILYFLTRRLIQPVVEKTNFRHLARYRDVFSLVIGLLYAWQAYPIFFSSVFMTETLFIVLLLTWILWGTYLDSHNPSGSISSLASLTGYSALLGILALTRPIALFWLPVLIWKVFSILPKEKKIRKSIIPLLAWMIPILPWTIRNILVFHTFVFISTNSGINLFIGNNPTFGYYESGYKEVIRKEFIQKNGADEVAEDRLFMQLGMDEIVHDPKSALIRGAWKFYFLYLLDKEPWPWEEYNQGHGLRFAGGIPWPTFSWKPWFFIPVLWGILYCFFRRIHQGNILFVIGLYTLACMVFFARSRFRMPVEPLLTFYIGLSFLSLVELAIWGYGKVKSFNKGHSIDS